MSASVSTVCVTNDVDRYFVETHKNNISNATLCGLFNAKIVALRCIDTQSDTVTSM